MYRAMNNFVGDVVKVTPSSKVVGDMALLCLRSNVSVEAVQRKDLLAMASIVWPASAVEMAEGYLGEPHHGYYLHHERGKRSWEDMGPREESRITN